MRLVLLLAVVLGVPASSLASGPSIPTAEDEKGAGFADIAVAANGVYVPSGDGTVRRLEGETLPVVFDAGRKLVSITVSEDGKHLAAVGAGVVARSSDGGRTFRLESIPDSVLVYAAAFAGQELLLFDVKGRGFRSSRPGAAFQPMALPRAVRYWTASFSGRRGFVVGEQGVLLATQDAGKTWTALTAPGHDSEGVLAVGSTVWVSAQEGLFRSDNGGQDFRQVFTSAGSCYRMGARGKAVVAACGPIDHVLAWSADGEHFQDVPVPNAANMMSAVVTPEGQIVAVGANDLMVLATPERGRIVATSEIGRKWLNVITSARAAEQARAEREKLREQEGPGRVQCRSGQRGVVLGIVRGAEEAPLTGVTVELMANPSAHGEGYQKAKTGVGGSYRFEPTALQNVRVLVEVAGYAPFSRMFSPCPAGETILDIPLQVTRPKGR